MNGDAGALHNVNRILNKSGHRLEWTNDGNFAPNVFYQCYASETSISAR